MKRRAFNGDGARLRPVSVTGDPVLAAIERHRIATAAYLKCQAETAPVRAAFEARNPHPHPNDVAGWHRWIEGNRAMCAHPIYSATLDRWEQRCNDLDAALSQLAATRPTTLAGVATAARYLAEHMASLRTQDDDPSVDDGRPFATVFAATIADALASLAGGHA